MEVDTGHHFYSFGPVQSRSLLKRIRSDFFFVCPVRSRKTRPELQSACVEFEGRSSGPFSRTVLPVRPCRVPVAATQIAQNGRKNIRRNSI